MKRILCLILILCLFFSGCGMFGDRIKDPVTFFYLRSSYQEDMADVFVSEQREAAGHRDDLSYLLALYLMGPSEEDHVFPLPLGTRILSAEQTGSSVALQLSEPDSTMTDVQFTLACTCLSLTCMDLTNEETVTITCGTRSVTMNRNNLTLFDSSTAASTEERQ